MPDKSHDTDLIIPKERPVTVKVKVKKESMRNQTQSHEPETNSIKNQTVHLNQSIDNQQLMYGEMSGLSRGITPVMIPN